MKKAREEKLFFTNVSSKVKNTRIQHRSPWPSRPYDPPAHGGMSPGPSFPPCSPRCRADACLSATHREQSLRAQAAGTSPCLLSLQICPLGLFSVSGGVGLGSGGFHYEGTDMNGGFVGVVSSISSSAQPPSPQPESFPALLISFAALTQQAMGCSSFGLHIS